MERGCEVDDQGNCRRCFLHRAGDREPSSRGAAQLYAADQNSGNIDVFNSKWQMTGTISDPNFAKFPAGYAAFNVQNLSVNGTQTLFVTYANQSTGGGIVDEFSTNGTFIKTLINDTAGVHLDSPWGLAIAPQGWGKFGGDLLVGNNNPGADGLTEINAYNLRTEHGKAPYSQQRSAIFRRRTLGNKLRQRWRRRVGGHAAFHRRAG